MSGVTPRLAFGKGNYVVVAFDQRDSKNRVIHTWFAVFDGTKCLGSFGSLRAAVQCLEDYVARQDLNEGFRFFVLEHSRNECFFDGLRQARKYFEDRLEALNLDQDSDLSVEESVLEAEFSRSVFSSWLQQYNAPAGAKPTPEVPDIEPPQVS